LRKIHFTGFPTPGFWLQQLYHKYNGIFENENQNQG